MQIVKENIMHWDGVRICRIYLTSSNSFKEKAAQNDKMHKELKKIILLMDMPRFIWCVDLATIEENRAGLISGRLILDSTVSTQDENPWLLMHDSFCINAIEYGRKLRNSPCKIDPYYLYKNNLQDINSIKLHRTSIWEDIYND